MATYLALYQGRTIDTAQVLYVSVDPSVVAEAARRMLDSLKPETGDPASEALVDGRRRALRIIAEQSHARP